MKQTSSTLKNNAKIMVFVKQKKAGATIPSTTLKPLPTNPAQEMESPQTDEEAQQIATSRALSTAKEILQKGGTQEEAAEGAKAVAREILREFQLAKMEKEVLQVAEVEVGLVSFVYDAGGILLCYAPCSNSSHFLTSADNKDDREATQNQPSCPFHQKLLEEEQEEQKRHHICYRRSSR